MAAVNQQQLRLWFDQIDLDKNGVLNVREVQKCLALNQLAFSLTSTNMLMRLFDTDHAGVLSFQQVRHGAAARASERLGRPRRRVGGWQRRCASGPG